jgi:MFS family permease
MADKLFNKNFNIIFTGQFISALGSSIYAVTIMLLLKKITGSGTIMGVVQMVAFLPAVFFGPFSGTLVDLLDRKKIIVRTDIVCGLSMILLSLAGFPFIQRLPPLHLAGLNLNFALLDIKVWMVIVITIVIGTAYSMFRPAVDASIPDIVPAESFKKASSLLQSSGYFTLIIGSSLGGVLFPRVGPPLLIFLNGLSYLLAALAETFLSIPPIKRDENAPKGLGAYWHKTKEGLIYLWNFKGLRVMILTFMCSNALFPPIILSLPFFLEDILGLPANYYGYMMATYMIGGIVGFISYGAMKVSKQTNYRVFVATFFLAASLVFLAALSHSPLAVFILFGLVSVNVAIITLIAQTVIPKVVPAEKRGRVYGTIAATTAAIMPISFGVSGIVIDLIHRQVRIMFIGVALICFIIALIIAVNKPLRHLVLNEG